MSVQVFCPFFNWVVCLPGVELCEFLYILEIRPLSEVSSANMFTRTIGSLFILMLFSLAVQKLSILMKAHCLFSFMSLALGDILVKIFMKFSCLFSPIELLWYHDLYLSLLSILSLFLCGG